jgi:hypothetical protein
MTWQNSAVFQYWRHMFYGFYAYLLPYNTDKLQTIEGITTIFVHIQATAESKVWTILEIDLNINEVYKKSWPVCAFFI